MVQRITDVGEVTRPQLLRDFRNRLLPGIQGIGVLQHPGGLQLCHVIVEGGGKLLRRVRPLQIRRNFRRIFLFQLNAALLADLREVAVDLTDELICRLVDGRQTGAELRQFLVLAPGGQIAEAVGPSLNAEILTDHIGHTLRL